MTCRWQPYWNSDQYQFNRFNHFYEILIYKRIIIIIMTWATRQAPHVELNLLTFPEHLRSSQVFDGVCVAMSLVVYAVSCVLLHVIRFIFFRHCVVYLFFINEFEFPSCIFRPSFNQPCMFKQKKMYATLSHYSRIPRKIE